MELVSLSQRLGPGAQLSPHQVDLREGASLRSCLGEWKSGYDWRVWSSPKSCGVWNWVLGLLLIHMNTYAKLKDKTRRNKTTLPHLLG